MKISIIYFSSTGTTKHIAESIKLGCESVKGVTAKIMDIQTIDDIFLSDSSCVIMGTPTYFTSMPSEVMNWLDHTNGKMKGKLGGAFATAGYVHGGGDLAIQGILTHMLIAGMLTYSGGCACGEPTIHLGPVAISENYDQYSEIFQIYGQRMASQAEKIFLAF